MKIVSVVLLVASVMAAGCGFHKQVANDFQSNSYVAYVAPRPVSEQKMWPDCCGTSDRPCSELHRLSLSMSELKDASALIQEGDKIAVYLVAGYWNQNSETLAEDIFNFGKVRNEISIMTKVVELAGRTDTTLREVKSGADAASGGRNMFSGAQQTLIIREGQVEKRPIAVGTIPLYGPVNYNGGDLAIQILLSEMDNEDLQSYMEKIDEFLQENTIGENISAPVGSAPPGEFVFQTWGSYNIALAGYKALKLGGALYKDIHEQDDVYIDHAFTLTAPVRNSMMAMPLLREGVYAVVRASIDVEPESYLKNMQYDPYTNAVVSGKETLDQIWLVLAVVKVN